MSNQFIGLTMLVTLSSPSGAQLRGVVSSIEPGKSLTLRHGKDSKSNLDVSGLIQDSSYLPRERKVCQGIYNQRR
jgi:hypothetical protein